MPKAHQNFNQANEYSKKGNKKEAFKSMRKAAEQGLAEAQYGLGWMYSTGEAEVQDDDEAVKWFRKAADQGHSQAQCRVGYIHEMGKGLEQDDEEAIKWYKKAAEQGLAEAQNYLGEMYRDENNYNEAVKWFRKAADQGNESSRHNLSRMSNTLQEAPEQEAPEKDFDFDRSNEEIVALKKIVQERNIEHLIHFTRYENLESILENGIMTKDNLKTLKLDFCENDRARFDGYENSISLSVSSPHFVMFWKYKKGFIDAKGWVVIDIKPDVIWEYYCIFCKHNAADSKTIKRNRDDLYNIKSFEEMFLDDSTDTRLKENLGDCDPTDYQAEVLVFNNIPIKHIQAIYFENEDLLEIAESKYNKDVASNINFDMAEPLFTWGRVTWQG